MMKTTRTLSVIAAVSLMLCSNASLASDGSSTETTTAQTVQQSASKASFGETISDYARTLRNWWNSCEVGADGTVTCDPF